MGRIEKLVNMLLERRVGFKMDEVMSGDHQFELGYGPTGRWPMEFKVTWGPEHLLPWINPQNKDFMSQPQEGVITIGEFCKDVLCQGTLELGYFTNQMLRYTLDFNFNSIDYRYVGEKREVELWKPWRLPDTHINCYGELREKDTGNLVSTSLTQFRWNTTPSFLASFRLE